MEELIQTFDAQDEDGATHTLHVYEDQVPAGTRGNPHATIPGMKRIETDAGLSVNRRDKGEYEIVVTGEILRSADPKAP